MCVRIDLKSEIGKNFSLFIMDSLLTDLHFIKNELAQLLLGNYDQVISQVLVELSEKVASLNQDKLVRARARLIYSSWGFILTIHYLSWQVHFTNCLNPKPDDSHEHPGALA